VVGSRLNLMDAAAPATASVSDRAAALRAAREALTGLAGVLWQASGAELGPLMGLLDDLSSLAGAGRVAVAQEALIRGEVAAGQAGSLRAWIDTHAPSLAVSYGTGQVAAVVEAGSRPETAAITHAVCDGAVPVSVGVAVIREMDRLRPRLQPDAIPTVVHAMLTVGAGFGTRAVRELRARLLAEHGRPGEFQADQDAAAALISLSGPVGDELGAFSYQLTLDAEGKAVLEAAIGPLSAPAPAPDGTPDRRPARQRRGQALIEVCRRATTAGATPPVGAKATLVVTMDWRHLRDSRNAGRVLGSTADGDLLAPETMRKLACDADLIPAILAGPSHVLDLGRTTRLFSPAQVKALWLRDRGCTFPGCSIPAHWCQAHHLRHWIDGGMTWLVNAGLLCARHHTVVHRDHLYAEISADTGQVEWDVSPGSYDRALAAIGVSRFTPRSGDASADDGEASGTRTLADRATGPIGGLSDGPLVRPLDGPLDGPSRGPLDSPLDRTREGPLDSPLDSPREGPQDRRAAGHPDGPLDEPPDRLRDGPFGTSIDTSGPLRARNDGTNPEPSGGGSANRARSPGGPNEPPPQVLSA
jgi:hypothetical protein